MIFSYDQLEDVAYSFSRLKFSHAQNIDEEKYKKAEAILEVIEDQDLKDEVVQLLFVVQNSLKRKLLTDDPFHETFDLLQNKPRYQKALEYMNVLGFDCSITHTTDLLIHFKVEMYPFYVELGQAG